MERLFAPAYLDVGRGFCYTRAMYWKRFLLFGFDSYYPEGGFHDLISSYDTENEALEAWDTSKAGDVFGERTLAQLHDWGEIVDLETGQRTPLKGSDS